MTPARRWSDADSDTLWRLKAELEGALIGAAELRMQRDELHAVLAQHLAWFEGCAVDEAKLIAATRTTLSRCTNPKESSHV